MIRSSGDMCGCVILISASLPGLSKRVMIYLFRENCRENRLISYKWLEFNLGRRRYFVTFSISIHFLLFRRNRIYILVKIMFEEIT